MAETGTILTSKPFKKYTREELMGMREYASSVEDVAIAIPPEIHSTGEGLITEKGKELAKRNESIAGDPSTQRSAVFRGLVPPSRAFSGESQRRVLNGADQQHLLSAPSCS